MEKEVEEEEEEGEEEREKVSCCRKMSLRIFCFNWLECFYFHHSNRLDRGILWTQGGERGGREEKEKEG